MSSSFGVSHGLSAVCNSSTCTRQTRDQLLAASSAASRGLVFPCAASLGHQTGRGFVRRCNKPAAPLEASLAYSAIDFSRALLSRSCNLSALSSVHPWEPGTRVPHTSGWPFPRSLRVPHLIVRSKPFNLLRLLRQVWSPGGQGFHQPQLSQSVAQHSPPSRVPGHPGLVVRLRRRNFPDRPSRCASSAHVGSCLVSQDVTSSRISCSVLCMSCVHRSSTLAD